MENPLRQPLIMSYHAYRMGTWRAPLLQIQPPLPNLKSAKALNISEYYFVFFVFFSPHQNLWILFLTWFSQIFASHKHLKAFRKFTWFGWRVKYAFTNSSRKNQRPEKDWTNFTRQESMQWFSKEWHCSWQPGWYDSCGKIQREIMCN